jgi:hypothetical protein
LSEKICWSQATEYFKRRLVVFAIITTCLSQDATDLLEYLLSCSEAGVGPNSLCPICNSAPS